jgi:hypothetical protein
MNTSSDERSKTRGKDLPETDQKRPQELAIESHRSTSLNKDQDRDKAFSNPNKRKHNNSSSVPVEPFDRNDKDNEYGEFEVEDNDDEDDESDISVDQEEGDNNNRISSATDQHLSGNSQLQKQKNREHAKNTRMRRKNYIESLKDQLTQLQNEQDRLDRERKVNLNRLIEQTQVRQRVLEELMRYRCVVSYSEKHIWLDRGIYMTFLEETIVYTLPVTPYRTFPPAEVSVLNYFVEIYFH